MEAYKASYDYTEAAMIALTIDLALIFLDAKTQSSKRKLDYLFFCDEKKLYSYNVPDSRDFLS